MLEKIKPLYQKKRCTYLSAILRLYINTERGGDPDSHLGKLSMPKGSTAENSIQILKYVVSQCNVVGPAASREAEMRSNRSSPSGGISPAPGCFSRTLHDILKFDLLS